MSGTIQDGKDELMRVYGKRVVVIPAHKPMQRKDLPDLYFRTSEELVLCRECNLNCVS